MALTILALSFTLFLILGVPVAFDGTASTDPDGDPLSYAWDFDASDGVGTDATGPTVSHTYAAAGDFTVIRIGAPGRPKLSRSPFTR